MLCACACEYNMQMPRMQQEKVGAYCARADNYAFCAPVRVRVVARCADEILRRCFVARLCGIVRCRDTTAAPRRRAFCMHDFYMGHETRARVASWRRGARVIVQWQIEREEHAGDSMQHYTRQTGLLTRSYGGDMLTFYLREK